MFCSPSVPYMTFETLPKIVFMQFYAVFMHGVIIIISMDHRLETSNQHKLSKEFSEE